MPERNIDANQTITLGEGVTVNRVGFGAMRISGPGGWGLSVHPALNAAASIQLLRSAVDLGVNYLDAADCYGPQICELLITAALYPYPDELIIATKGGVIHPAPNVWIPDGRPSHLRRALDGSLRRLRLERVDHYLLHKIDPHVPFEESLGALISLRDEGKIRLIGLSSVNGEQLRTALSMTTIAAVQNRYSFRIRDSEDVLQLCGEHGVTFIPWEPLDKGAVTLSAGALETIAREREVTSAQVALAWLLHHSDRILLIPGTTSPEHLEENIGAGSISLSADYMDRLEATEIR